MVVTLVGASWKVVAGDQTGVDFIPMKFCGVPSRLALGVGALSGRGAFWAREKLEKFGGSLAPRGRSRGQAQYFNVAGPHDL